MIAIDPVSTAKTIPPCVTDNPRSFDTVGNSGDSICSPVVVTKYARHRTANTAQRGPLAPVAGLPIGAPRSPRRTVSSISHTVCNRVNGLLHIDDTTIAGLLDPDR